MSDHTKTKRHIPANTGTGKPQESLKTPKPTSSKATQAFAEQVRAIVSEKPDKAARILSSWIQEYAKSKKTAPKKAA